MIRFLKITAFLGTFSLLVSCSQVLQTIDLEIDTEDSLEQQEFSVIEKTLTIGEAKKQRMTPYLRTVLQSGRGENARPIPEKVAMKSNLPPNKKEQEYIIGVGDVISFSKLTENNKIKFNDENVWPKNFDDLNYKLGIGDTLALTFINEETTTTGFESTDSESENTIFLPQKLKSTINSRGRIGSDGSVLLLEVGRLEAIGKTLNELRTEVRNNLIRNGVNPRFQLEILEFKSQRAYLTINRTSQVILLDDKKTTLREILTSAKVGLQPGTSTRVKLQRSGKEHVMTLRAVFKKNAPEVHILDRDHVFVEDSSSAVFAVDSVVNEDGNILIDGLGTVKAAGFTLGGLQSKIKRLIENLPDSQNTFQIQITEFNSQKALVNIPGTQGGLISLGSKPVSLEEVLTESGLSIDGNSIIRITLHRDEKTFIFTLDELFKFNSQGLILQPNDHILTEILTYKEDKVFVLGAISPTIVTINPSKRDSLADILFTVGGVLSSTNAKRSEVYLLRGSNPVVAYHLDAQSPTRLIVADAMELRPNDILYVAEQPIASFNRALATIVPLRLLLRDIQDDNIP